MIFTIVMCALAVILMIVSILLNLNIKLGKVKLDCYWMIILIFAAILVIFGKVDIQTIFDSFTSNTAVNPLKILLLFISMTLISIFLDEVGFFKYLANQTLKIAHKGQTILFICLYLVVSILTVFTSNDIIVLTFTPFICYFCKNAKLNPIPYLVGEFVASNTMSMMFIIGNPTNIYIASSYYITFFEYLKVMALPTLAASLVAFIILFLLFRKELKKTASITIEDVKITNKPYLIIGLTILIICTVMLAVSSYIGIPMWIVSVIAVGVLFVSVIILSIIKHNKPIELSNSLKRAPWQLVPFVLSMFVLILSLEAQGVTSEINQLLGSSNTIYKYGISSFLSCNVINNIPMSVLFCKIVEPLSGSALTEGIYATIIGSNLGAYLTPIGALAGIMWTSLINKYNVKYNYLDFIKYGVIISIPTILASLAVLNIIL